MQANRSPRVGKDVSRLRETGWEYVPRKGVKEGRWLDPFTGAYHTTRSALTYQMERDNRSFSKYGKERE